MQAAKVRNGHFWTNLIKFRVFVIYKGLSKICFRQNLYVNVLLKVLEPIISFVLKRILDCAENGCFSTTNFGVACFEIGFINCIFKICEFSIYSKYFGIQKLSQDSRNSGKFLWHIIFRKTFFKLGQTSKNDINYQKWQISTIKIAN